MDPQAVDVVVKNHRAFLGFVEKRVESREAAEDILQAANARVKLHRARQALKLRLLEACATCAEHGCLDCSCKAHRHA